MAYSYSGILSNNNKSYKGFPGLSVEKNLPANGRRWGFDPWVRKSPWRRTRKPLQYSCLGNPMDREAWQAIVHGVAKNSDMT